MKKIPILALFVTLFMATSPAATEGSPEHVGISFNGQDGQNPGIVKMSIDEFIALVFRGIVPVRLAFYGDYMYEGKIITRGEFQRIFIAAMPKLQPAMQKIIVEYLNAENSPSNPLFVDKTSGQPLGITPAAAEQMLKRYLIDEPAPQGKHIYLSFDISLTGKVIPTVPRKNYSDLEGWFILAKPGCKRLAIADDICANMFPSLELMESYAQGGQSFDQAANAKGNHFEKQYVETSSQSGPDQDQSQLQTRKLTLRDQSGNETVQTIPAAGNIYITMAPVTATAINYGNTIKNSGNSDASSQQSQTSPAASTSAPPFVGTAGSTPPGVMTEYNPQGGTYCAQQSYGQGSGQSGGCYGYNNQGQYGYGNYGSNGFVIGLNIGAGYGSSYGYNRPITPYYGGRGGYYPINNHVVPHNNGGGAWTGNTTGGNTNTNTNSNAYTGGTLGTNTWNGINTNTGSNTGGHSGAFTHARR